MYSLLIYTQKKKMQAEINNNGWRHLGQSEQRKSSVLFPIQSQKSPDSGFLHICEKKKELCPPPENRLQR